MKAAVNELTPTWGVRAQARFILPTDGARVAESLAGLVHSWSSGRDKTPAWR